jgi:hypothetical protein
MGGNILSVTAALALGQVNKGERHLWGNGDGGASNSGLRWVGGREALRTRWRERGGEEKR